MSTFKKKKWKHKYPKMKNHKNNEVYSITLQLKITVFYKHVLQEINGYFKNFQ